MGNRWGNNGYSERLYFGRSKITADGNCSYEIKRHLQKRLPTMWETWVCSLGWKDPLEKETATHSSILAWDNPMDRGSWRATVHGAHRRVRHDLVTKTTTGGKNHGGAKLWPGVTLRFSSVAQSCPALCDPTDCRMPGFSVHPQLPEPLPPTYRHQA